MSLFSDVSSLLRPANEFTGRYAFIAVCHSVLRGSVYDGTYCLAAWSHVPSRGIYMKGVKGHDCERGMTVKGVSVKEVSMKGSLCERGFL